MSKLNGQYGIVDESDSNRTIISLKLTPAAAEKIKKFIENKGIGGRGYINFSSQDDGKLTEVKILAQIGTTMKDSLKTLNFSGWPNFATTSHF